MQENHRNEQEESDIVATSEPYTPLRKIQRLRIRSLIKSNQFLFIQCFLKFLFIQSLVFVMNVINVERLISLI